MWVYVCLDFRSNTFGGGGFRAMCMDGPVEPCALKPKRDASHKAAQRHPIVQLESIYSV